MAGAPSPERQRLAELIVTREQTREELERLQRAAPRAMHAAWDADAAITEAEVALWRIEQAAMEHRVLVLSGDAVDPPHDVAKAREALASARENAATADAIRKRIDTRLRELQVDLPTRQNFVRSAAVAVPRSLS
jgi:hypothetical protein